MLFQMSISSGILILFILLLRLLAINRLPKKVYMVLWDIALIRLLLPVNLPFSYGIFTPALKAADNGLRTLTITRANVPKINAIPLGANAEAGFLQSKTAISNLPLFIYLSGTIIFLLLFLTAYIKEHRKIQDALPLSKETEANLRALVPLPKRVRLLVSDRISTPLTCGVLSPKIILFQTFGTMDQTQLKYVLTHELIHIKRADNLRKLMMPIAVSIHWVNPSVWMMYILYNRDMELSCDEKVISTLGEKNKKSYAMALVTLAEQKHSRSLFSTGFGKNAIKERIVAIMKYKKVTVLSIIFAILSIGGAITVFAKNDTSDAANITISSTYQYAAENSQYDAKENASDRPHESLYTYFIRSEHYPEYEKLGLSYDVSTDHLIYDGCVVAYFHDETAPSVYTHITDQAAKTSESIGILVVRDADYNILSLEKVDVPTGTDINPTLESNSINISRKIPVFPTVCSGARHFPRNAPEQIFV